MAKRVFRLPRRDELTKEQRKVLRLPKNGQHLVVGSPGTGKSVVALLRMQELGNAENVHFLTFNHVLNHANKNLLDNEFSEKMNTAMSWLYDLHWNIVGGSRATYHQDKMPEIKPHKPDYKKVSERFAYYNADFTGHSLIVDEGQDLPPEWYECIESLHIKDFFVVADQNQQITEEYSSKKKLMEVLGLENDEVIELKENWRNTSPIAAFSNYFYTDKTSPKPQLPNRPSVNTPILFEYKTIDRVKEQILSEYDRDPSKLIGFFVANEGKREWWAKDLQKDDQSRKYSPPVVSTYFSSQKGDVNIEFNNGGIVVLNDKSVKGIEFDIVFILIDGFKPISNDKESLMKRLYVMSSRARERLYLLKSSIQNSILEEILPPENETITIEHNGKSTQIELLKRRQL
ncbi:AAA family ATPase [Endozoicomonas euniceicola]|uniref:DNA 3'-5' helicase II n=1 Tax=Endozoicomonas euniceicola TaxID=1234143 RepID=A0ABY6GTY5_9GAMM|nr:AAA family ATPase [Endozoicomonas euniceicola]UYM16236.1 AAA family ATPase [Endozoicomonas euniceicola]